MNFGSICPKSEEKRWKKAGKGRKRYKRRVSDNFWRNFVNYIISLEAVSRRLAPLTNFNQLLHLEFNFHA